MIIQWYGQSCFKITSGETTIAIDPYDKKIGFTPPRFQANLTLITHKHDDHANSASLTGEPFVISEPGEYEVKGVFVHGFESYHDKNKGRDRGMNTMYKIGVEGIRLLHMGDFGEESLSEDFMDAIGEVDILMIPVGGKYTIDGNEAAKIVKQLEPKIVIPMHYKISGLEIDLDTAEQFLKNTGAGKREPSDKLTIKKKEITESTKTEIIILQKV
mgnify:CR=1 FL=1